MPTYPKLVKGKKVSEQPEETIAAVIEAAALAVGWARLNEALATILLLNATRLVELEYLFGQEVDFQAKTAFKSSRIVKESRKAA